ncbi:MAG: DUF4352 domain-containing protein [Actinomycetota bacterium]|nr:DUF4352 domain-containing protein [Actinomycetota bacterium]
MTADELTCRQDGTPTRLACAGCGAGICPNCMTRTPVGFKCPICVGGQPPPPRRRGILMLAAALLLGLVGAGFVLSRPARKPTTDPTVVIGATGSTAPTAEPMLGEAVRDGQITFTVTDLTCGAKELQVGGATRTAEGKFCQLRLSAHNTSGGPANLLAQFQYLLDAQSKTYGPDLALSQSLADNGGRSLSQLNINPDLTVGLVLIYDVPDTLDPVEAQLRGTGGSRFGVRVQLQHRP